MGAPISASEVIATELAGPDVSSTEQNLEVMIIEEDVGLMLETEPKRQRTDGNTEGILEEHSEALEEASTIVTSISDSTTQAVIEGGYTRFQTTS